MQEKTVEIFPITSRAKNRVSEHGKVMRLLEEDFFNGQTAILVQSIRETWNRKNYSHWMGWFTESEANWTIKE